jgi:hypothetical protein
MSQPITEEQQRYVAENMFVRPNFAKRFVSSCPAIRYESLSPQPHTVLPLQVYQCLFLLEF